MSRHRKFAKDINVPGKKAAERETRIRAAQQRMRFHSFVAWALLVCDKWSSNPELQEDVSSLPVNERRYIKMQIAKCHKRVKEVVRLLQYKKAWPTGPTNAFFQDASAKIRKVIDVICIDTPSMPEVCRYMDVHAILTYLVYVALHEWQTMELRSGNEDSIARYDAVDDMITALQQFSDHIIPADSWLITPLNDVYCYTRNYLHSGAPVPFYESLPVRYMDSMLAA